MVNGVLVANPPLAFDFVYPRIVMPLGEAVLWACFVLAKAHRMWDVQFCQLFLGLKPKGVELVVTREQGRPRLLGAFIKCHRTLLSSPVGG